MLNRKTLFRMEAINRKTNPWLGASTIIVPNAFLWFSLSALLLTTLIVAFVWLGSYTTNEPVNGVIKPKLGVSKSMVETEGEVVEVLVEHGQNVSKGTPLMILRDLKKEQYLQEFERQKHQRQSLASGNRSTETDTTMIPAEKLLISVAAKVDGTVYQIHRTPGQMFYKQQDLIAIAPAGDLIVEVNVSAKAQGQLTKGTKIVAQMDAYDNDPQGRLHGTIIVVGLAPQKKNNPFAKTTSTNYKVLIQLDLSQTQFEPNELLGKTVNLKLPLEKRALYQWLLDPMKKLFV